jgi:hypothetical protein
VGEEAAVLISAADGSVLYRCPTCGIETTATGELVAWLGSAALIELGGCECRSVAPGGAPPGDAVRGLLGASGAIENPRGA